MTVTAQTQLDFLNRLTPSGFVAVIEDCRLLLGWVSEAISMGDNLAEGVVIDRQSGFNRVAGFDSPTDLKGLHGRYRVLAPGFNRRYYHGAMLGLLEGDSLIAVILVNRLPRIPVFFREPLGMASDFFTDMGLVTGFHSPAMASAIAAAGFARDWARRHQLPLVTTGQSQAGGTAQLQIAALMARKDWRDGDAGFITMNAACATHTARRLVPDPAMIPGVNFNKDRDPLCGPHSLLPNRIGRQIYIHADGSAGPTPQSSLLAAILHPGQHLLGAFKHDNLAAAISGLPHSPIKVT